MPDAKAKVLLLDDLCNAGDASVRTWLRTMVRHIAVQCQKQRKSVILPALPLPGEPWTAHYPSPFASGCGTERHRLLACQQTMPSASAAFGPAYQRLTSAYDGQLQVRHHRSDTMQILQQTCMS